MSKDSQSSNLRLLGSPVNLSYRSKKKDEKKNIRNRPRSALQNSCFTPDNQEKHKRPFSADAKEHLPSTRNLLKSFSAEVLQSYNNAPNNIKIVPPTAQLLEDKLSYEVRTENKDREICSNTSDHGSEDTYISLGTKIKARAQSPKGKNSNCKNFIKFRNIARKAKKIVDNDVVDNHLNSDAYGLEVKITEKRNNSPTSNKNVYDHRSASPSYKIPSYDSYYFSLEKKVNDDSLVGRVSFGEGALHSEVEQAINTYSRRLNHTKQQLSLVEEESTQDLESVPPHNISTPSPEISLEDENRCTEINSNEAGRNTFKIDTKDEKYIQESNDFYPGPRTYSSFYDDFQSTTIQPYKISSTIIPMDSSSKDSGYTDSGTNDEKSSRCGFKTPVFIKTNVPVSLAQPKSLECIPLGISKDADYLKTFPPDKKSCQWTEPLNHSRLLYKDFFLKKEGHVAQPPNNSPQKKDTPNIPGTSEIITKEEENDDANLDYPPYLLNSNTKAYTSKVIEDYKKEIEAINNLHELTLKDIKTDAISPTPLSIDKIFDQHANIGNNNSDTNVDCNESTLNQHTETLALSADKGTTLTSNDVAKVSTQELIQNYLKVKKGDYSKEYPSKNLKKFDKKINNVTNNIDKSTNYRQSWNNKNNPKSENSQTVLPVHIKNPTQAIKIPLSARLDSVHNDRDIESWMSLSAPSPRILEIENITEDQNTNPPNEINITYTSAHTKNDESTAVLKSAAEINAEKHSPHPAELKSNATVLDIYSMLKEIESFGDNPVISENKVGNDAAQVKEEESSATPKDNFLEIFQFLEKVEQSANDALSVVTSSTPQTIPNLEMLLKLPQTELAQRLVTASLQLEERSCCIALLQESLSNHKEQMINKVSNLEKQSMRNIARVKHECEDAIKRHQTFIDQLISDKKTLNHRIEQLVDERRSLEERWRRSAQALEERYKLELKNQHDKMAAAQQVARQRWVRQKAEKIKELTVKGLEGELREMAERQQKEIADLKMSHAEQVGRLQSRHAAEMEQLRRSLEEEKETALVKERQAASGRLEKQILELELTYQEQRKRLVAEMRAENERVACGLSEREKLQRMEIDKWKEELERLLEEKRLKVNEEIAKEREKLVQEMNEKRVELEQELERHKSQFEADLQASTKKKVVEIAAQHKAERDRAIEKAIESMEAEAQAGRKELQEALRRNKEQYEIELKELAQTEQATLRRYQDAQARVRQTEDRCAELEVEISQLQTRNKVLTEKTIQLEKCAEDVRASCEASWSAKVDALRQEMEQLKKTHDEQMHQLYAKVKVAVARKDAAIQAVTRDAAKYQEKVALLEQKLQQQRKDFFVKQK